MLEISFLYQSLTAAMQGRGQCAPNPAVGAVIANSNNEIVATGYHQGSGTVHAEVDALQKINFQAQGMTMYVTLEPCCHHGRTPPCTDALIKSGIKRVIYGYQDPNPIVAGKGAAILKKDGITCELIPLPEINDFYKSYHHWHQTKKPFVTAKIAMSLDGIIAEKTGKPIQITGPELTTYTHYHRKISDAILTTAVTIKNDNPKLNVRYQDTITAKPIYILDSTLSLPVDAQIFQTAKSVTLFHVAESTSLRVSATEPRPLGSESIAQSCLLTRAAPLTRALLTQVVQQKREIFEKLGARCVAIERDTHGLNLSKVLEHIGNDGIHDLWIEAGGKCFSAFIQNNLLQRALIYIAPKWLGEGIPAFDPSVLTTHHFGKNTIWKQIGKDGILEILL